jgi:hypothetical protein
VFETGILAGVIVWSLSALWLIVSILRLIRPRWRQSAIFHTKFAAGLFVLSFIAIIWCNQFAYLDYGLTSREGLEQARAERKAARHAEQAAANTKAEAERTAAAKLKAEEEARQAALDAEQRKKDAEARAAEEAAKAAEEKAARLAKACSDTTMAFVMSQEFVKRSLKAPSTAEFPWITDDQVAVSPKPDCGFHVVAWVDAQNGFGAQIRSRYVVDLKYLDGSGEWQLTAINIQ